MRNFNHWVVGTKHHVEGGHITEKINVRDLMKKNKVILKEWFIGEEGGVWVVGGVEVPD